jgi:hypothetical protein
MYEADVLIGDADEREHGMMANVLIPNLGAVRIQPIPIF